MTTPNIRETSSNDDLKRIQAFALQKFNLRPEQATNLDEVLISQLRANILRFDAEHYLDQTFDDQAAYGLPFEAREWKGQFQVFVPDVQEWHIRRDLPVRGNHPPFDESYGLSVKTPFNSAVERITGLKVVKFSEQNPPVVFGQPFDYERTPYGRLKVTADSTVLELRCEPTLYQTQKFEELQKRFLERGIRIEVNAIKGNESEKLPPISLAVESKPLPNVNVAREVNFVSSNRHLVSVGDEGEIRVNTLPAVSKPRDTMYGFGYFSYQIDADSMNMEEQSITVGFHFEPNAMNHDQAKGSFVFDKVAAKRWYQEKNRKKEFREIREGLEKDAGEDEAILPDKWSQRKEIVNEPLPFLLKIEGYKIPCALRAMVDFEKSGLQVELISTRENCVDPIKKILLDRVIKAIGKRLGQEMEVELEVMKRSQRYKDVVRNTQLMVSTNVFNYA